jgi:hypothetical protein
MDTKALRKDIINKIKNSLEDDVILDIARMLKVAENTEIIFSEEQTLAIEKSIKSYEQGNYVTDEVAEAKIQQWLKD